MTTENKERKGGGLGSVSDELKPGGEASPTWGCGGWVSTGQEWRLEFAQSHQPPSCLSAWNSALENSLL